MESFLPKIESHAEASKKLDAVAWAIFLFIECRNVPCLFLSRASHGINYGLLTHSSFSPVSVPAPCLAACIFNSALKGFGVVF